MGQAAIARHLLGCIFIFLQKNTKPTTHEESSHKPNLGAILHHHWLISESDSENPGRQRLSGEITDVTRDLRDRNWRPSQRSREWGEQQAGLTGRTPGLPSARGSLRGGPCLLEALPKAWRERESEPQLLIRKEVIFTVLATFL